MEQKPLWKIDSGEFAGWRQGDDLYDAKGKHVGFFRDDIAYSLNGEYLGEVMDGEWLARHAHRVPPRIGARESRGGIRSTPRARRSGRPSRMWEDPEI
jgi:hypothetical protein